MTNVAVAVIVQCRLSSTRLPGKALMDLCGKPLLAWTLGAMRRVPTKRYFLATDPDSQEQLRPLAAEYGFEIFAGSLNDVLDRFCSLIEWRFPECTLVVRATGDNPFLFCEAAAKSIEVFERDYPDADYFTFSGLPHGSGVELFKAQSILRARTLTDSAYDHEHVGPAIYRHPESFKSVFAKAPTDFYFPDFRTTVDTFSDFKRAENIISFLNAARAESEDANSKSAEWTSGEIISALEKNAFLQKTVLFVPSVRAGRGTGHLRRALFLARETLSFVYVPKDAGLKEADAILEEAFSSGLEGFRVIRDFPMEKMRQCGCRWDFIFADLFSSTKEEVELLRECGALCSMDDASSYAEGADYLLNVIPSEKLRSEQNAFRPDLLCEIKNRRADFPKEIKRALVCISGESRDGLAKKAASALKENGIEVTVLDSLHKISNLKERLFEYDLIVTHYGFTAFEAVAANCAVLLVATSALHKRLAKKYGFVCLSPSALSAKNFARAMKDTGRLTSNYFKGIFYPEKNNEADSAELPANNLPDLKSDVRSDSAGGGWKETLAPLVTGERFFCPLCGCGNCGGRDFSGGLGDKVIARTRTHTFRICKKCGVIYLAFSTDSRVQYEADYFGSEYRAQYGRSYLEDFDSIKEQGVRRMNYIRALSARGVSARISTGSMPAEACSMHAGADSMPEKRARILDIGCAYGPFLAAAEEAGFVPYGTDISENALDYVQNTLGYECVRSSFADFDCKGTFGFEGFDAVTMWFVIEHVRDLKSVLSRVHALLNDGGVFAFSTPSGSGVSGRFCKKAFFEQSPRDHYTVWTPRSCRRILRRFGFRVRKIVPTGIHPERIPFIKKHKIQKGSLFFSAALLLCRLFRLGDTFEVYCIKNG